ncbi:MAG TPA: MFS transporter [Acidobacteriota bacterium]|jgi:ACS family hexuronate transporter-like MFS transporter|nr:MFS transporter [Acidobacteriota bacterium]
MTAQQSKIRHLRWYICTLLFFAATINYLDRQTVGVLKPLLQEQLGWTESGYGWIQFSFQTAYAIMQAVSGRLLDFVGVRGGFIAAVIIWSLAAMAHALARGPVGFAVARFALGVGEAANFPASIKSVAEWFPKKERALATGIFNSGTNVGVMLSPLIAWLATVWHWQAAFIITGAIGFLWLLLWSWLYESPEKHARLSEQEKALILSDKEPPTTALKVPWVELLRYRQAWAFFMGKMMTDPVWWFYLYWLPSYLHDKRGLSALSGAKMLIIPYVAADVGSVFGGWLSGFLIKRGWRVGPARLLAMLVFAVCMPGAIWAVLTQSFWLALSLISLATACHQAWSANLFTLSSDMFPKSVVGSVVGLGGMCGAIGGMFMTLVAGGVLQWFGSYVPLFFIAGLMHPMALIVIISFTGKEVRQAEVEVGLKSGTSPVLIISGLLVAVAGGGLATAVWVYWSYIVQAAHSVSTAAGGLVASIGVALLGLTLIYAGLGRKRATNV